MTVVAYGTQAPQSQRYKPLPARGDVARGIQIAGTLRPIRPVPPAFACLSVELAHELTHRWREPCEAAFEFVLARNPHQLAHLIAAKRLAPGDLTFAAEILGRADDSELVRAALVPLLSDAQAVVREGAIYGLSRHLDDKTTAELRTLTESDPSPAVRIAAEDALGA